MKKQLEKAYLPDKEGKKKKIVVGLGGGICSFVVAYLLKIQKFDLIAVTVITSWDNFSGDQDKVISCHMGPTKLNTIQEFCHNLGIPHFTVKGSDEFKDEIVDEWMASKISGRKSTACWNCHDLRMKLLYNKMKQLGAQSLATGHFAKIFQHEAHNTVYVHSSNDEVYDQSELLNRLPHSVLKTLSLPLSDLQKKEVLKLAENFGLSALDQKLKMHECFKESEEVLNYLVSHVPANLNAAGELMTMDQEHTFPDHEGVLKFTYGRPVEGLNQYRQQDNLFFTRYLFREKKIEVAKGDYFLRNELFLVECKIAAESPWYEPLKGVIKVGDKFTDCVIYPKNLEAAYVKLDSPEKVLEGEIITIFKKKGKNSKVILSGKVRYLTEKKSEELEEEGAPKVDYSKDY